MSDQEYVFVWKIHNFSNSCHKIGHKIRSPFFTIDILKESQWFLDIYPQGETEESKEFISIYLHKKKNDVSPEEFEINYDLDMIGGDGELLQTTKYAKKFYSDKSERRGWGSASFIKIKAVTEEMGDWPEDILTLRCRMFFKSEQSRNESEGRTEIGVYRQSFAWNVRIPDISTQILRRELFISRDTEFEIILNMPGDALKIDICSRKEFAKPKSFVCRMVLIDPKGKELISKSSRHLFEESVKNEKWGFPEFITKKFLDDNNESVILENKTICLLCKCVVSNGIETNTILDSSTDEDVCSTLQMRFRNMLLDPTYSDIKLKAENVVMQAHKSVLAVSSPVFSAMFQKDMIEAKTNTVDISDVEASTLKLFLEFLYTETLEKLDYEFAKKLILCADKYQVFTLKEKCASFLESALSLGNVLEILSIADMIGHERLKCAAIKIVVMNSENVFNFPEWSLLIGSNVKLATQIISKIVCSKKDTI